MSTNSVVYIVHNDDAKLWPDYIIRVVSQKKKALKFETIVDSSIQTLRTPLSGVRAVIVVLSPGHLDYLKDRSTGCYANCECGLIFQCGAEEQDLSMPCSVGKLSNHFPVTWQRVIHDARQTELRDAIENMLLYAPIKPAVEPPPRPGPVKPSIGPSQSGPISSAARLLQTTARSEEPTTITVTFENALTDDANVEVILSATEDSSMYQTMDSVQRVNPYTYTFIAPEHREGKVNVQVNVNKQTIASHLVLTYNSVTSTVQDISQIYIHLMNTMCQLLQSQFTGGTTAKLSLADIDDKLSSLFDLEVSSADVPAQAFEQLFGLYRYDSSEEKEFELPTLIHFAAKFGLQELCAKLTDLPDANSALSITNRRRQLPQDIARANKHGELAKFLEYYLDLDHEIGSMYSTYYNVTGNKTSGNYLNARQLGLNPVPESNYMSMTGNNGYIRAAKKLTEEQSEDFYTDVLPDADDTPASRKPSLKPRVVQPTSPTTVTPATSSPHQAGGFRQDGNMPARQAELVEMMTLVKEGKITLAQMEARFREWQAKHQGEAGKSFKEKNEHMKKLSEEIKSAREQSTKRGSKNMNEAPSAVSRQFPALQRNSSSSLSSRDSAASRGSSCTSGIDTDHQDDDLPLMTPPLPPPRRQPGIVRNAPQTLSRKRN